MDQVLTKERETMAKEKSAMTKEKSKTSYIIENFLNKNKFIFYKRVQDDIVVFMLPYRVGSRKIVIDINLFTFENSNLCRMNFKCKLNEKHDSSKELLDMNANLVNGNLSVMSNTNYVSFNTNFVLDRNSKINDLYYDSLYNCFSILYELQDKDIVEVNIDEE